MSIPFTTNVPAINAVTTTTTSDGFDVSQRQQITVQFIAASITTGNGVFSIDASNDGTNWITGISFQDALATASTTWITSKTLTTNSTAGVYVKAGWRFIRIKCVVTSDGTYTGIIQNGG